MIIIWFFLALFMVLGGANLVLALLMLLAHLFFNPIGLGVAVLITVVIAYIANEQNK